MTVNSQKFVSLTASSTDPEDDRLMETDKFLGELTANKPFLSTYGFELWRRYSANCANSNLDTETVLSLVVAK
jgi:hypothetical protein